MALKLWTTTETMCWSISRGWRIARGLARIAPSRLYYRVAEDIVHYRFLQGYGRRSEKDGCVADDVVMYARKESTLMQVLLQANAVCSLVPNAPEDITYFPLQPSSLPPLRFAFTALSLFSISAMFFILESLALHRHRFFADNMTIHVRGLGLDSSAH